MMLDDLRIRNQKWQRKSIRKRPGKHQGAKKFDCSRIKSIFYDCDGVLTDNRVMVSEDGTESVFFNRSDGLAISLFRSAGIHQYIISTETNPVVERRAEKLQIPVVHGLSDKRAVLEKYADGHGIELANSIYIGNDINDMGAMRLIHDHGGLVGCPVDAEDEVKEIADWVSKKRGGYGVVRDLYRVIVWF